MADRQRLVVGAHAGVEDDARVRHGLVHHFVQDEAGIPGVEALESPVEEAVLELPGQVGPECGGWGSAVRVAEAGEELEEVRDGTVDAVDVLEALEPGGAGDAHAREVECSSLVRVAEAGLEKGEQ